MNVTLAHLILFSVGNKNPWNRILTVISCFQTSSSLIEGRWQLMFTTRPGTASPIQVVLHPSGLGLVL